MIANDTVTLWHAVRTDIDHASWECSVVSGCRIEEKRGGRSANPQATVDDSSRVFIFADIPVSDGDMVAPGAEAYSEPTSEAMRVISVERWSLGGAFHHMEVECR